MSQINVNIIKGRTGGAPDFPSGSTVTGIVTATSFVGDLTGDVSGTASRVTDAAQTNITSVGILTGLDTSGDVTVIGDISAVDLTLSGNLTVNGTTTEINSRTLTVDDKHIQIGAVVEQTGQTGTLVNNSPTDYVTVTSTSGYLVGASLTKESGTGVFGNAAHILSIDSETQFSVSNSHQTPGAIVFTVGGASDLTADGGGFILKSTTNNDKKIIWDNSTDSWDINQNIEVTGNIEATGTVTDSKGELRSIPLRAVTSAAATLVLTDAGKVVSTDTTGWTVPALSWTAGDTVTLLNNSAGGLVITCSAVTTYLTSDGTTVTGPTLGARGMATLYFTASNTCYISGAGLS